MKRRAVLTTLLGLLGIPAHSLADVGQPKRRIELLCAPLAGYPYYEADKVLSALKVGVPFILRREPSNPYDRNAVEVITPSGVKLGYLPRTSVSSVARNLDCGVPVQAEVCAVHPEAESWRRIYIQCFVELS